MRNLFNWSVVVSALTIYLYWYGYWYTEGYIRYFGHDIRAYDIPIQHIIVAGALQSLVLIFKLIIVLILVSFLLQFSKNQYFRFFKLVEIGLLYIWFNIVSIAGLLKIFLSRFFSSILRNNRIVEKKNKWNINGNKNIKILIKSIDYIKNRVRCVTDRIFKCISSIMNLNRKISHKEIVEIEGINAEFIKNKIKKEDATTFDIQYLLHVLIMFTVVPFLLMSLDYTNKINESGFNNADKSFQCSIIDDKKDCDDYYSQIKLFEADLQKSIEEPNILPRELNQNWYLTDICLHRRCLVFNENKVAKFVDITDKEILMRGN